MAVLSTDPSVLVGGLNALVLRHGSRHTLATAIVAVYDPRTRRLRWSQAGHLPGLLVRPDAARPLEQPAGPVLGVWPDPVYATATTTLRPDDLLLLFTDGLVDSPRHDPVTALATVAEAARIAVRDGAGDDRITAVMNILGPANPDDDTTVLAVQVTDARSGA
jgi:serine phosphatase RsbU (regulator of sigma subunit)